MTECIFCDGELVVKSGPVISEDKPEVIGSFYMYCDFCHMQGPRFETEKEAIEWWDGWINSGPIVGIA